MLPRQLFLDREDVLEHPVVSLRPDVVAAQRVDQLAGDPDSIDRLADAAFQDVADTELARDHPHIHGATLVGEAAVAGDHEQLVESSTAR